MAKQLVECIPNFSEGRRPEVVAQIVAAMQSAAPVTILDQHSDHDHNRTVVTFVAEPQDAVQAAYAGIARAAELIDLDVHEGEHPRLGATDVVPFVPIQGMSLDECVQLAQQLGEQVGTQLGIPVYLYEAAATTPARTNLEAVRRGEYEGLRQAIESDPDRKPDFGPATLGKAGATIIGARTPLIAYNVYLTSDDVDIANKIARAIRHSSGGLRFVKSIGLLVDGRAQVSMNLTNFNKTPIARVTELIRREAERYGLAIHHSELVGLAPQQSLIDAARWYLQLDQFEPDQVLETRLFDSQSASGESGFLEALASDSATPGGGSAAAHCGAVAAALVAMVGRLTVGRKKYQEVEDTMRRLVQAADTARGELMQAVDDDAAAFEAVMAALKLPKEDEAQRSARMQTLQAATLGAAEAPLGVAAACAQVIELAASAAEFGNSNAISDAGAAAELARAGLRASLLNVHINVNGLADQAKAAELRQRAAAVQSEAETQFKRVHALLAERGEISLD